VASAVILLCVFISALLNRPGDKGVVVLIQSIAEQQSACARNMYW
jgi:hypothetical protein